MTWPNDGDLPFRDDFARRVLDAADAQRAQQKKYRGVAVAVLCTGVALLGIVQWKFVRPPTAQQGMQANVADETRWAAFPQEDETGPMDVMFPEAAQLTQFAEEFDTGSERGNAENGAVFFPDRSVVEQDAAEGS